MFNIKHLRVIYKVWSSGNTYIIDGLPVTARIDKTGGFDALHQSDITIRGLSMDKATEMKVLEYTDWGERVNDIVVEAREGEEEAWYRVFAGNAISAVPQINTDGTMDFHIHAVAGACSISKVVTPTSVKEAVSAETLFRQFANEGEIEYKPLGKLGVYVKNCVFTGSPKEKMRQLAVMIGCDAFIDDNALVTKEYGGETYPEVPTVSVENGMLGYPRYTSQGISFRCLLRKDIKFAGLVNVQSVIKPFCGVWQIYKVSLKLDAYYPHGGDWHMDVDCMTRGREIVVK